MSRYLLLLAVPQAPPAPQAPELPPIDPVIVQGFGTPEWVGVVAVIGIIAGAILILPLVRALARRLEGKGLSDSARQELDHLHERVSELEQVEARLAELENRIEFSERLLARHRDAESGSGG